MTWPHPWHPDIVDVQIAAIGSLAILAVPGEFTCVFLGSCSMSCIQIPFKPPGTVMPAGRKGGRLKIVPKITLRTTEMHTGFLNNFGCNKMQFQGKQRNLLTLILFLEAQTP